MTKPKRIQRKRTHGWRMPSNTVYVGRPTKWGNPFNAGDFHFGSPVAVLFYENWITKGDGRHLLKDLNELRGKNLCCWCALGEACHADVLLKLANKGIKA